MNLTVPAPTTVMELDFIGVHSFDDGVTLARIPLPSPLLVPPNLRAGLLKQRPHYSTRIVVFVYFFFHQYCSDASRVTGSAVKS